MQWSLEYKEPAGRWIEALPLGNGSLGAMSFGNIKNDQVQLNLDTLWSGVGRDKSECKEQPDWDYLKSLLFEGKYLEAESYAKNNILGDWTESYLPAGALNIDLEEKDGKDVTDYHRMLSLNHAVQTTCWKMDNQNFCKEMFVSMADNLLAIKMSVPEKKEIEVTLTLDSQLRYQNGVTDDDCSMEITGTAPTYVAPNYYECQEPVRYEAGKGIRFGISFKAVVQSGKVCKENESIKIITDQDFYVFLTGQTNYQTTDNLSAVMKERLDYAEKTGYEELKDRHLKEYTGYFDRVDLQFDEKPWNGEDTTSRIIQFASDNKDLNMIALLFHYARYLMICSSKPGTQAANLQGIWNDQMRAPWSSNYTVNINTQMNYWMAESCNLSEFHMPLMELIEKTAGKGQKTAKKLYGLDGWVSHHNIDLWGHSTPVGKYGQDENPCTYSLWPMSSGWLCRHLWEHYCYTRDLNFLKEKAYPLIRESVRFYLQYLTEYDGYFVTSPSTSPENEFYDRNGEKHSVSVASTMDISILKELFGNYLKICEILEIDILKEETEYALKKLPPFRIGRYGQLQEWYEDYKEADEHHRHVSHLYGLYPASLIREKDEALRKACEASLNRRGDDGTGWGIAWKANLWARLKNGEKAFDLLKNQMRLTFQEQISTTGGGIYPNLFCAHPPFQIDGNFGFAAAVVEMLLQSHENEIVLLPALPEAWRTGQVKGLRARGGYTVSLSWKDGKVVHIDITADQAGEIKLHYNEQTELLVFRKESDRHFIKNF